MQTMTQAVASWLLAAITHWAGVPALCGTANEEKGCDAFVQSHREPVYYFVERVKAFSATLAEAVVEEPYSPWKDPHARARVALDLASIAFMESGMQLYVEDGTCNTREGIALYKGRNCDGGQAYTLFQIHPVEARIGDLTGADLLSDPKLAARVALQIYSRGPSAWTTWPRARELATRWAARHPFEEPGP